MRGHDKVKRIIYEKYLDKVFGAWLGKSVAGTVGAPYEGRKELFDYKFHPKAIEKMLPNDDLDLQVLWLEVMEKKGIFIDSLDLADAFFRLCPYAPGEYAYFKKNYARGINPPLSGSFNNRYYANGMGCPIRSEIWACICPGNPALAAQYAALDGVLDHEGDSVFAEQFLAAAEATAFFEDDALRALETGMPYLPEGSRIRRLVEDTIRWSEGEADWVNVRKRILRHYGHPDCTNLYQNIGFTILALLHGQGDFIDTTMIALNCGYDTDCSCATAGALLGIMQGAAYLQRQHHLHDASYTLGVNTTRRSNRLLDLAEDTCRIGMTVAQTIEGPVMITLPASFRPIASAKKEHTFLIDIDYLGDPVIGWREPKVLKLIVRNEMAEAVSGLLKLEIPVGWKSDWKVLELDVSARKSACVELTLTVPESVKLLHESNRIRVIFGNGEKTTERQFGLNGAQVWKVYGPYWESFLQLPTTELGEGYFHHVNGGSEDAKMDLLRQFHLNTKTDIAADYEYSSDEYAVANIPEDRFDVGPYIGYEGPCMFYMERMLHSPEERDVHLLVGHSGGYRLWLNGAEISRSDDEDWWTAENKHHSGIRLLKGKNRILLKGVRKNKTATFSLTFTENGACTDHIYFLGSYTSF